MARFRVNCKGCGFYDIVNDADLPEDVATEWDAESTAAEARDTHQLREGQSVAIERVE